MAFARKYTDEQYAQAEDLVRQGATVSEAANSVGIPYHALYRRIKKPDPKPGGKARTTKPKAVKVVATDEQLTEFFAKAAVLPAVPMALYVGCNFCANHFTTQGPEAAKQLVELSKEHPQLRQVMEAIWREWQKAAWAALLAGYFGVPIAHHFAPDFVYKWIAVPMGLPPRGEHFHDGAPASNGVYNGDESSPAPTPFSGLDTESVLKMAESMGIKIELPDDFLTADATTAEDAADITDAAADAPTSASPESDAAPVETPAPDPNAV